MRIATCLIVLAACTAREPAPTTPPPAPPPAPAAPGLPAEALPPHGMILFGDLHGTVEIPRYVAGVVAATARTQPVVLALEMPPADTESIDAFLASDGGAAAEHALVQDRFWRDDHNQDGRRSVAMMELLEAVRVLRHHGARVDVVRIDRAAMNGDRDEAMAESLVELRAARPEAAIVVYAGNLHVMRKGVSWRPGYRWMAMRLAEAGVAFTTLIARHTDGSAWICSAPLQCGAAFVPGQADAAGLRLEPSADGNYDGWFGVGAITASPPAAFPELAQDWQARLAALQTSPAANRARAMRDYDAKDYAACAGEYASIADPTAEDLYNHACCLARAGRTDAAFERLALALAHGAKLAQITADEDLASLHGDPRWPPSVPAK